MKKTIKIINNTDNYSIECDNVKISLISKDNKALSGEELYRNLFSKLDLNEKIELEYIKQDDNLPWEPKDNFIFNKIVEVLKSIVNEINNIEENQ